MLAKFELTLVSIKLIAQRQLFNITRHTAYVFTYLLWGSDVIL